MNYIILNNEEFFKDKINLNGFKEVENDEDRIDAVFGEITQEVLEQAHSDEKRRDEILSEFWVLRNLPIFAVLKIDRGILLSKDTELVETLFGFFDKKSSYITIWGFNPEENIRDIEQYIVVYNKSLGYVEDFPPSPEISTHENGNLQFILSEIESKIL